MTKYTHCIATLVCFLLNSVCYAQSAYITTIAGNGSSGFSGDGGPATSARMGKGIAVLTDGSGNVFFSDMGNQRIRKINPAGTISTYAGGGTIVTDGVPATNASLDIHPGSAIAADIAGNIYFADGHRVRKINAGTGILTTVAGNGTVGYSGDGGPATAAKFYKPTGICFDAGGNMYISDEANNCVRKVNTAGIISTYAGSGSSGITGDGGPATAAKFDSPDGLCIDAAGNLYVADFLNHVIRKINPSGIISTYAGCGIAGYSGDGGPATVATFNNPSSVCMDSYGSLYITEFSGLRVRKIDPSGTVSTFAGGGMSMGSNIPATSAALSAAWGITADDYNNIYLADGDNYRICKIGGIGMPALSKADSFKIATNKLCVGPEIYVRTKGYAPGMYVKTDFGDGTRDSTVITMSYAYGGYAIINHSYHTMGAYVITHVLYHSGLPLDTLVQPYIYSLCRTFPVKLYYDGNSNCKVDTGENYMYLPSLIQIDSNGVPVDTISATGGFYYEAHGPAGTIYSFKLVSIPGKMKVACPATGVIEDTVIAGVTAYPDKYFGFACPGGPGFDLTLKTAMSRTTDNNQVGSILISNKVCDDKGATVTLYYSPKWVFDMSRANPTVASVSGNSATWNIGSLSARDASPEVLRYSLSANPITGSLKIGDTVQSYFIINPTAGDENPGDNVVVRNDKVQGSHDPNAIYANPEGCLGEGITLLEYTITFENTGNDTAHNIYLMDTLSDKLDPNSLRIVMASANMNFSMLRDGGHTIARFDFPNIKLLDSSYHDLCHGSVIYTIDLKKGLTDGSRIMNQAGIFFDANEVVMTNISENIIGCPVLSVSVASDKPNVEIFPNPVADELTIETDKQSFSSYTISNSIGQVLQQQEMTTTQTTVHVKALPAGLYYVTLRGTEGVVVQKFVKM